MQGKERQVVKPRLVSTLLGSTVQKGPNVAVCEPYPRFYVFYLNHNEKSSKRFKQRKDITQVGNF